MVKEVENDPVPPAEPEPTPAEIAEAEEAFRAGFEDEGGQPGGEPADDEPPADPPGDEPPADPPPADPPADPPPGDEPPADPPKDPEPTLADALAKIDDLSGRLRRSEGHLGRLQESMKTAAEAAKAAGGAVPTTTQISVALDDVEEFAALAEEFPEFAAVYKAVEARKAEHAPAPATPPADTGDDTGGGEAATPDLVEEARTAGREAALEAHIEARHAGWQDLINTDRFSAWIDKQPEDVKQLGASANANDAVELLDKFKEFTDWIDGQGSDAAVFTDDALLAQYEESGVSSAPTGEKDPKQERQQESQDRLAASVPATTPSGARTGDNPTDDEEAAFAYGFKNAHN